MPQPLAVTAFMASPGRFELPAPRLGGVCSIQLSYGDIFDFSWSRMERSASQDFDDLIIRRPLLYQLSYTPISRFEGVSIQCQQTGLYTPPLLSSFFLQFRKFFLHLLRVGLLTLFDREPDICGGANSCGTGGSSASLYWLGAVREREKAAEILLPIVPPPWRVDRSTTYGAMSSAL